MREPGEFQGLLVDRFGRPDRGVDAPLDLECQGLDAFAIHHRQGHEAGSLAVEAEAAQACRRQDEMGVAVGHGVQLGAHAAIKGLGADHERAGPLPVDHHGAGAAELHDRPLDRSGGGRVGQAQDKAHHQKLGANSLFRARERSRSGADLLQSQASDMGAPYHRPDRNPNRRDGMAAMLHQQAITPLRPLGGGTGYPSDPVRRLDLEAWPGYLCPSSAPTAR